VVFFVVNRIQAFRLMNIKMISFCAGIALLSGVYVGHTTAPVAHAAEAAYPGLVLPTQDNKGKTIPEDQRPGYRGLIQGKVPTYTGRTPSPTQDKTLPPVKDRDKTATKNIRSPNDLGFGNTSRQTPMSKGMPLKVMARNTRPDSIEKFRMLALTENKGPFTISDSLLEGISLPPFAIEALSKPPPKSPDGLSMTERSTKLRILQMFSFLEDAKTKKERKRVARIIRTSLMGMEDGYNAEKNIPERIKLQIGMPKVYIERRNKELAKSIKMVKKAEKYIKQYL